MFGRHSSSGYTEVLSGIKIKTIVYGKSSLMSEFLLSKNTKLPAHQHIYEQTGYLIKGHIKLKIGDKVCDLLEGDSWNIPSNMEHSAEIIQDSIALEIFTPLREDYMKFVRKDLIF